MKKIANFRIDDLDQTGSIEEGSEIPRLAIDGDYLFITFVSAQEENSNPRGEYRIHSPRNNEIIKILLQQPLISKMWLLEFNYKSPKEMIHCSEIEKIQRCRAASEPDKLRLILTLKGKDSYFDFDFSAPAEHLEPVYTLAQFS